MTNFTYSRAALEQLQRPFGRNQRFALQHGSHFARRCGRANRGELVNERLSQDIGHEDGVPFRFAEITSCW